jgi:hypothetical protein
MAITFQHDENPPGIYIDQAEAAGGTISARSILTACRTMEADQTIASYMPQIAEADGNREIGRTGNFTALNVRIIDYYRIRFEAGATAYILGLPNEILSFETEFNAGVFMFLTNTAGGVTVSGTPGAVADEVWNADRDDYVVANSMGQKLGRRMNIAHEADGVMREADS